MSVRVSPVARLASLICALSCADLVACTFATENGDTADAIGDTSRDPGDDASNTSAATPDDDDNGSDNDDDLDGGGNNDDDTRDDDDFDGGGNDDDTTGSGNDDDDDNDNNSDDDNASDTDDDGKPCPTRYCQPEEFGPPCGDDGCGGSCGTCGDRQQCIYGVCQSVGCTRDAHCTTAPNLTCDAWGSFECVECVNDDDCADRLERPICREKKCMPDPCEDACRAGQTCTAHLGYPICAGVPNGCHDSPGCTSDTDCLGEASNNGHHHCVEGYCCATLTPPCGEPCDLYAENTCPTGYFCLPFSPPIAGFVENSSGICRLPCEDDAACGAEDSVCFQPMWFPSPQKYCSCGAHDPEFEAGRGW